MEYVTEIRKSNSSTPTQLIVTEPTAVHTAVTTTITTTSNNNNNGYNENINNRNNNNIDTQLLQRQQQQQQQLNDLYTTTSQENITNSTAARRRIASNFVAIPLSERPAPIVCISQQQQNGNNHQENYSNTSLTRTKSCLVRWRQFCFNFLTKIMGSNNPSEADRYEYYDYKMLKCK